MGGCTASGNMCHTVNKEATTVSARTTRNSIARCLHVLCAPEHHLWPQPSPRTPLPLLQDAQSSTQPQHLPQRGVYVRHGDVAAAQRLWQQGGVLVSTGEVRAVA